MGGCCCCGYEKFPCLVMMTPWLVGDGGDHLEGGREKERLFERKYDYTYERKTLVFGGGHSSSKTSFWKRVFFSHFGHILVMFWSCFGHILVIFWSYFDVVWTYFG